MSRPAVISVGALVEVTLTIRMPCAAYARLAALPEHWRLPDSDPIVVDRLRAASTAASTIGRSRRLWSACRRRAIEAAGGIR